MGGASSRGKYVTLAHGGGGQLTDELVGQSLLPRLGNEILGELLDSGIVDDAGGRLAMSGGES